MVSLEMYFIVWNKQNIFVKIQPHDLLGIHQENSYIDNNRFG